MICDRLEINPPESENRAREKTPRDRTVYGVVVVVVVVLMTIVNMHSLNLRLFTRRPWELRAVSVMLAVDSTRIG